VSKPWSEGLVVVYYVEITKTLVFFEQFNDDDVNRQLIAVNSVQ
jgi:hypothetical protein